MSRSARDSKKPDYEAARAAWEQDYSTQIGSEKPIRNRSGIDIKPLYTPDDSGESVYLEKQGFPGQLPMTRGIYPTMHRGRVWSQRQLIGLGTPEDFNARLKTILAHGGSAGSLIPCNSVYRGLDADQVDPLLLGTCGAVVNTVDDMDICYRDIPIGDFSAALNDPLPFTLLALMLGVARRRGIPWERISGTSNQSDYISHFVANHMFFRIALPGSRRVLTDHIAFCATHLPRWNPVSVVGQHMQQAGATPAEAMGLTLCTAIQYANDCVAKGMNPDEFLPRFTFFFDISISFFEEIAKFRAGRRIWQRIVQQRFGATDPRAWRFKFHAQTSGADLTRQQPLNNISRVAVQAMAGIFGGLQSLHTDAHDEVLGTPTEKAARIAVATQNVLREEAHLTDVIDPLGGSYYVELLTDEMEAAIESVIERIDDAGGMYAAVESGFVQRMLGESALAYQERLERGEETIVGVNKYTIPEAEEDPRESQERPEPVVMQRQLERLRRFKAERNSNAVSGAVDLLTRACHDESRNLFEKVVDAAAAGVTHGEICACLRRELGDGEPLIVP